MYTLFGCPLQPVFSAASQAAAEGNLELVKHVHRHGGYLNSAALAAARYGHLDVLRYVIAHGGNDYRVVWNASRYCHFEILQWAIRHCTWQPDVYCAAVCGGSLDIVQFLWTAYRPLINHRLLNCAAIYGHLQVLQHLQSAGYRPTIETLELACTSGNLEMVKHLCQYVEVHESVFQFAIESGNSEIIKYLHFYH